MKGLDIGRTFVLATAPWVLGGLLVWGAAVLVASPLEVALQVAPYGGVAALSLILPMSAFAGGSRLSACIRTRRELSVILLVAASYGSTSYVGLAHVGAVLEFRATPVAARATTFPLGARTPDVLRAERDSAIERAADAALAIQPDRHVLAGNWFEKQLQFPRVVSALAVVMALLGYSIGVLTASIRPGVRRRLRWLLALVCAFSFLFIDDRVAAVLRMDPDRSGLLWSWLALAPHLGALAVLLLANSRRQHDRP